ncbi:hypothetical protein [Peribacillus butanolivorans]|uniref:Uncharacterized protein n=1 Tax=Peribacillus butanolivorans TaxID=421767 RepID=A0ABN5N691_9BACI|nr:hypothetical protein [Peribacillus butanolivorans]AXN39801.1 hypothetical protein DTO10_16495 [Peribacillus butanolivorans]
MEEYNHHIGKKYRFNKGDKIPQWMFKCDVAFFGTDVTVIAEKGRVHVKGFIPSLISYRHSSKVLGPSNESLIELRNKNGEYCEQVCPPISFRTDFKDNFII